jgi:hypothetical protein
MTRARYFDLSAVASMANGTMFLDDYVANTGKRPRKATVPGPVLLTIDLRYP